MHIGLTIVSHDYTTGKITYPSVMKYPVSNTRNYKANTISITKTYRVTKKLKVFPRRFTAHAHLHDMVKMSAQIMTTKYFHLQNSMEM